MDNPEQGWRLELGADIVPGKGVFFRVWAPGADEVSVKVLSDNRKGDISLVRGPGGYFACQAEGIGRGDRYLYCLANKDHFPDPASRFQPEGVHGPSEVVDPRGFQWEDKEWESDSPRGFSLSTKSTWALARWRGPLNRLSPIWILSKS